MFDYPSKLYGIIESEYVSISSEENYLYVIIVTLGFIVKKHNLKKFIFMDI